jgi:protein SCO1/2
MKSTRSLVIVFGILLALAPGLGACGLRPYIFHGTLIQSPDPAPDFSLLGHMGQMVSLSDFRGQLVVLYFGYATCPDVCPTTLAELHRAREVLGQRADQVQVLMVTVDPERDTAEMLADYVTHFDPTFIGLTGTPDEIAAIATYYGVFYDQREEEDSALGYLVDHTATQMVIDQKGHLKVVFPFGTSAEDIAADLEYMITH